MKVLFVLTFVNCFFMEDLISQSSYPFASPESLIEKYKSKGWVYISSPGEGSDKGLLFLWPNRKNTYGNPEMFLINIRIKDEYPSMMLSEFDCEYQRFRIIAIKSDTYERIIEPDYFIFPEYLEWIYAKNGIYQVLIPTVCEKYKN